MHRHLRDAHFSGGADVVPGLVAVASCWIYLGLPALYLFNVLRIIFLTVVGVYYHDLFDFMHLYFWQATLILMITSVWVMWILLVVSREKKTPAFLA